MDFKQPSSNPLARHFRQPSIYLKLPSKGTYWAEGSVDVPVTGEIPVLPMSTKDEITLKTPDALINGQGVVNVIQSCCPNIHDAWQTPSVDVDAILIAIRIASYGNSMDVNSTCPQCAAENEFSIDLSHVLASISMPNYGDKVDLNEFKIKLKPAPYFAINQANQISFEEQQILKSLASIDPTSPDSQQLAQEFDFHLKRLIELSISNLSGSTDYIELSDGSIVTNEQHISEFYQNCDTKVIKAVQAKLAEFSEAGGIKAIPVTCESCSSPFTIALTFDYASFFAEGS